MACEYQPPDYVMQPKWPITRGKACAEALECCRPTSSGKLQPFYFPWTRSSSLISFLLQSSCSSFSCSIFLFLIYNQTCQNYVMMAKLWWSLVPAGDWAKHMPPSLDRGAPVSLSTTWAAHSKERATPQEYVCLCMLLGRLSTYDISGPSNSMASIANSSHRLLTLSSMR
jgi:hypothetical protein